MPLAQQTEPAPRWRVSKVEFHLDWCGQGEGALAHSGPAASAGVLVLSTWPRPPASGRSLWKWLWSPPLPQLAGVTAVEVTGAAPCPASWLSPHPRSQHAGGSLRFLPCAPESVIQGLHVPGPGPAPHQAEDHSRARSGAPRVATRPPGRCAAPLLPVQKPLVGPGAAAHPPRSSSWDVRARL